METDWGVWEGRTLTDLRAELGDLMAAWEARGLDFRAPEGESPREVQDRLRPWLVETAATGQPTGAVAHKGVIRAIYALATGWDMTDKPCPQAARRLRPPLHPATRWNPDHRRTEHRFRHLTKFL